MSALESTTSFRCAEYEIRYYKSKYVEEQMKKEERFDDLVRKLQTSDLCSGEYEGGFKVWESSLDLCRFILTNKECAVAGRRVLELGCGAGLPCIAALLRNAEEVVFQDMNDEVLDLWTKQNVKLNGNEYLLKSQFHALEWSECSKRINKKFDVILSSETIYNPSYYQKLHDTIDSLLTEDGFALIAAKVYYFGCGGSVSTFETFVKDQNRFSTQIVFTSQSSIPRQIIKMTRII